MPTIEPLRALDTLLPMGLVGGDAHAVEASVTEPESRIDLIVGRLAAIVIKSLESRWWRANRDPPPCRAATASNAVPHLKPKG
jgi:hypothetical protein